MHTLQSRCLYLTAGLQIFPKGVMCTEMLPKLSGACRSQMGRIMTNSKATDASLRYPSTRASLFASPQKNSLLIAFAASEQVDHKTRDEKRAFSAACQNRRAVRRLRSIGEIMSSINRLACCQSSASSDKLCTAISNSMIACSAAASFIATIRSCRPAITKKALSTSSECRTSAARCSPLGP